MVALFASTSNNLKAETESAKNSSANNSSADEAWTEDVAAAIKSANDNDKDILLLFTGSDWCPPCKKLEEEVLSVPDFQVEASQHYVLVKLDFPQQTEQEENLKQQNDEWAKKFGVDSFPTVILLDKNEKPYAIAGYEDGGFQNYLGMLEESRQRRVVRDEKFAEAKDKKGTERARLLDEGIGQFREEIIELYYPEVVEEIVALDKDDTLGLKTKWHGAKEAEMRKVILTDMMMISRLEKPERAIKFIDEVLSQVSFPNNEKLAVYQMKLNLVRKLQDPGRVDQMLDEMINLDGVAGETKERLIVKKIYLMIGSGRDEEAIKLLEGSMQDDQNNLFLLMAKGEILDSKDKFEEAVKAYDQAIGGAKNAPDILIELVSAKADALFELNDEAGSLQVLDNFSDDSKMPADLRAEALLHKAMIMRDMKRVRQARLAENRAIQITESPKQRAEIQKIVDRLREKYGD